MQAGRLDRDIDVPSGINHNLQEVHSLAQFRRITPIQDIYKQLDSIAACAAVQVLFRLRQPDRGVQVCSTADLGRGCLCLSGLRGTVWRHNATCVAPRNLGLCVCVVSPPCRSGPDLCG